MFGFLKKKCAVCNIDTKDIYKSNIEGNIILCRDHLVERWRREVLENTFNMMVIEPDFANHPCVYLYANGDTLLSWEYPQESVDNVYSIIDSIDGKECEMCRKKATVAFINRDDYKFPMLEDIKVTPTYLCKNCMVNKVSPLIRNAPDPFYEYLYGPTNEKGLFHPQDF